jgi:hypothetical protein
VTAFLGAGAEQDVLYDPKCRNGEPLVYVSFRPKVSGQMKALRRIVQKKRYALVTVEGTMHGPEPVKVDPKLPDWLKDRFKNAPKRYGHLDSLEMMIEVVKVVEARDVDDGMKPKVAASAMPHSVEPHHQAQLAPPTLCPFPGRGVWAPQAPTRRGPVRPEGLSDKNEVES